jgi:hypothetical protein
VPAGSADRRQQQTLTPDQLAQQALAAIDPSTQVAVDPEQQVAGRSAYHLVLTPRDAGSKIGSVRISIDGATKLPLGVQVFARGGSSPALDVSYTSITFAQPDPSMFTFTPPAGVTVTEGSLDPGAPGAPAPAAVPGGSRPQLIGSGWTTVALVRGAALGDQARAMLSSLPAVSGAWGSGRLLDSAVLSVLITDDGRMLAGAVPPEVLYAAAAANR